MEEKNEDRRISPAEKLVPCKNKARWWFYSDKFLPGCLPICSTCLLAFLEGHVSYAVLMKKPWFLRGRCHWAHEPDYAGMIMSKLSSRDEIVENAPGIRVGFRSGPGKALYVAILASMVSEETMIEYEIQTREGLTNEETEIVRKKARWLAEELVKPLAEMCPSLRLDSIRVRSDDYVACLTGGLLVQTLWFTRNLVNDMTDPAKPHLETKAKFNAKVRSQLAEAQRYVRIGLQGA